MASKFARVRRVGCALAAACIANALAPAKQPDAVRRGVFNGAAAALAAAAPAWAVDSSAAIAVERSGFAPTIKQTGRMSRYEDTILGPRGSKTTVAIAFDYPSTWTAFKNSVDVIDGNTGTVATVVAAPAGHGCATVTERGSVLQPLLVTRLPSFQRHERNCDRPPHTKPPPDRPSEHRHP